MRIARQNKIELKTIFELWLKTIQRTFSGWLSPEALLYLESYLSLEIMLFIEPNS